MIEDIIGGIGVALIVITYFLLQIGKIKSTQLLYSLMNVIGSLLILISVFKNWNLSSFLIEVFWILISLIGIFKVLTMKQPD